MNNFLTVFAVSCFSTLVAAQYYPYPYHGHHDYHHPSPVPSLWQHAQYSDFHPGIHSPSEKISRSDGHHGHHGLSLKSMSIPNDLADKLFPFTIRIASHGEPHLPVVRVGHHPFTIGAGLWGKPELNYGKHVHHHPHHYHGHHGHW